MPTLSNLYDTELSVTISQLNIQGLGVSWLTADTITTGVLIVGGVNITTALSTINETLITQGTDLSVLTLRVTAVEADIASLDATVFGHAGRLLTAEGDIDALETAVSSLGTRMTTAEGDINTLETNVSSLSTRMTAAEGTLVTQGTSITNLGTRMTSAEGTIVSQGTSITNLGTRMTTAEGDISILETDVYNIEQSLLGLNTDLTVLETKTQNQTATSGVTDFTGKVRSGIVSSNNFTETTATTGIALIDLHSGGHSSYDARISSTGGSSTVIGQGSLLLQAGSVKAAANTVIEGTFQAGSATATNCYVEVGYTTNKSFIDFHSGYNTDYDVRLLSSAGVVGTSGKGTLELSANKLTVIGETEMRGNVTVGNGNDLIIPTSTTNSNPWRMIPSNLKSTIGGTPLGVNSYGGMYTIYRPHFIFGMAVSIPYSDFALNASHDNFVGRLHVFAIGKTNQAVCVLNFDVMKWVGSTTYYALANAVTHNLTYTIANSGNDLALSFSVMVSLSWYYTGVI